MQLASLVNSQEIVILLIEDSAGDAAAITRAILFGESFYDFKVIHKPSLSEGCTALAATPADVVLLDLNLPDAARYQAIRTLHSLHPHIPIIVISGSSNMNTIHQALKHGAQEFLVKGECSGTAIRQNICQAIIRKRIELTNQHRTHL